MRIPVPPHYDLRGTVGAASVPVDGTGTAWRATRTPEGPATARYVHRPGEVEVTTWGAGAAWLADHAAAFLGADDDPSGFDELVAGHPVLGRLHRERRGIRFGRTLNVFEAIVPTICGQKVTGIEAKRAWRGIVRRWREPAPGPVPMRVPPPPEVLAAVGYHELHPFGLERKRAEIIRAVARTAARLESIVGLAPAEADARLRSVAGIGVWSSAEVRRIALGDPDAVSYGDFHLPHAVAWTLLGQRKGSDELMAELLAPFAPHRGRVIRLIELGGGFAPRRGPRLTPTPWLRPRSA